MSSDVTSRAQRVAYIGMFTALAFVLSWLEFLIPFDFTVPGMKLGLANIITVFALYKMRMADVVLISLTRIILAGFAFSGLFATFYALAGFAFSLSAMALLKKSKLFTVVGVSVCGGIFHNVGQVIFACLAMKTSAVIYYLPILLISGTLTGALIGIAGGILIRRIGFIKPETD